MTRGQARARTAAAVIVSLLLHLAVGAVLLHARDRRAVSLPPAAAGAAPAAMGAGVEGAWIPLEIVDGASTAGSKPPASSSASASPAAAPRPPPARSPPAHRPSSPPNQSERSDLEEREMGAADVPEVGSRAGDERLAATAPGGEHARAFEQVAQAGVNGQPRARMDGPGGAQGTSGDGADSDDLRGEDARGDGARGDGARADGPGADGAQGAAGSNDVRPQLHRRLTEAAQRCYPPAARRFRLTGAVPVSFCVGEGGAPVKVALRGSSGSGLLDRSAVECVLPGAAPLPGPHACYALSVEFR